MKAMIQQHETYPFQLRVWVAKISKDDATELMKACGWRFKGPMYSYDRQYWYYFFVYKPWGKNDLRPEDFAAIMVEAARTLDLDIHQILVGDHESQYEYDAERASVSADDADSHDQEDHHFEGDKVDGESDDDDEEVEGSGEEDEAEEDDDDDDGDEKEDEEDGNNDDVLLRDDHENADEDDENDEGNQINVENEADESQEGNKEGDDEAEGECSERNGHPIGMSQKSTNTDGHPVGQDGVMVAPGRNARPSATPVLSQSLEEIADRIEGLHPAIQSLLHQLERPQDVLFEKAVDPLKRLRSLAGDIFAETTLAMISHGILPPTEETLRTALQVSPTALSALPESGLERMARWAVDVLYNQPDLVAALLEHVPRLSNEMKLQLARAYHRLGKVDDLMTILRQLELAGYRLSEVYHLMALAFREREPHLAELFIKKAVQQDPSNREAVEDAVELITNHDELLSFLDRHLGGLSSPLEVYRSRYLYEEKVRCLAEFSGVSTRALVEALLDLMEAYGFAPDRCWRFYTEYALNANLSVRDRMDILTSMPASERVLKEIESLALAEIDKGASADHSVIQDAYIALRAAGQERNAREIWDIFRAQLLEVTKEGVGGPEAGSDALAHDLAVEQWPDLSDERVAIVGGTRQVREKVVAVVREQCRPRSLVEVPPSWERNLSQSDVDRLLRGATFVVVIKGALKHLTTNMVSNWEKRQRHNPRMVYPQGRGVSGVLTAIAHHAAQRA